MIVGLRHNGLERFVVKGDRRRLAADQVAKIDRILARLDVATEPEQMDIPGFRLHPLKGDLADHWAVSVTANWRIVFRFVAGNAVDVDLVDYH